MLHVPDSAVYLIVGVCCHCCRLRMGTMHAVWGNFMALLVLTQGYFFVQLSVLIPGLFGDCYSVMIQPSHKRWSGAGQARTRWQWFVVRRQRVRGIARGISYARNSCRRNTRPKKMTKPQKSFSTVFFLDFTVNCCFLYCTCSIFYFYFFIST